MISKYMYVYLKDINLIVFISTNLSTTHEMPFTLVVMPLSDMMHIYPCMTLKLQELTETIKLIHFSIAVT